MSLSDLDIAERLLIFTDGDNNRNLRIAASLEIDRLRKELGDVRAYLVGIGDHPDPTDRIMLIDAALSTTVWEICCAVCNEAGVENDPEAIIEFRGDDTRWMHGKCHTQTTSVKPS